MKKDLKQEEINKLEASVDLLQSINDANDNIIKKQAQSLSLYKQLVESNDRRIKIQSQIIDTKDEIIEILEEQKDMLAKENLRLNVVIGIFLLSALVFCMYKIFTI